MNPIYYMEFIVPSLDTYTIYSKSGCSYCTKVKELLTAFDMSFTIVNCDEYLYEDKEGFLEFIKKTANKEYRTFPIVFHKGTFLGGFMETKTFIATQIQNDAT